MLGGRSYVKKDSHNTKISENIASTMIVALILVYNLKCTNNANLCSTRTIKRIIFSVNS